MPDVTDVEANVLGNGFVYDDFNGFLYTARVPVVDGGDELYLLPLDDIKFTGMLDRRFVILSSLVMGLVFPESGREISASFSKVHFATLVGNHIQTRS